MNITWHPGVLLKDVEKEIIEAAVRYYNDNKSKAADSLGISSRTIYNKLKEYEIERLEKEATRAKRAKQKNLEAQRWLRNKPNVGVSEERTMPMRERQEIQKLPLGSTTASNTTRGTSENEGGN